MVYIENEWRTVEKYQQLQKTPNMSKNERQFDGLSNEGSHVHNPSQAKSRKMKGGAKRSESRVEHHKKKHAKIQSLTDFPLPYSGEKFHQIIHNIHEEQSIVMPTHHELGLWRKQLTLLSKPHLPSYFKLLQMSDDMKIKAHKIYPQLNKKAFKNQFFYQKQLNKSAKTFVVKNSESVKESFLICLLDISFFKLKAHEVLDFWSQLSIPLTEEESRNIVNYFKNEDQTISWPVAIFQPYSIDFTQLEEILSNFQIQEDEARIVLKKVLRDVQQNQSSKCREQSFSEPARLSSQIKAQSLDKVEVENQERIQKQSSHQHQQIPFKQKHSDLCIHEEPIIEQKQENRENANIYKSFESQKIISEKKDFIQNGEQIIGKKFQKKFLIWFIGTSKYQITDVGMPSWSRCNPSLIKQLALRQRFGFLLNEVNAMIESLQSFHSQTEVDLKIEDSKLFLSRLCEYHHDDGLKYFCIPFRYEMTKIPIQKSFEPIENNDQETPQQRALEKPQKTHRYEKKVLIRFFKGKQSYLKWVHLTSVKANYALPKIKQQSLIFLYLIEKISFQEIAQKYFYQDFYYQKQFNTLEEFQMYFPQFFLSQEEVAHRPCAHCSYSIYQLEFNCCFICNDIYHSTCVPIKSNRFFGIRDEASNIWICETCQPCSMCYQIIGKQSLKCTKCSQHFHQLCGRIKGLNYDEHNLKNTENFICESCLKCKMCLKKLKDKQYYFDSTQNQFFCVDCFTELTKNNICHVCMSSRVGAWIQCQQCKKWIHRACDKTGIYSSEPAEQIHYWCPYCRKREMRKIFCEIIDSLCVFDELQFFTDPSYEKLPRYSSIIDHPMCLNKMKEKSLEGFYDENPEEFISQDFNLIISNALKYNMPKDSAYFQAKILNILGNKALKMLSPCFTPSIRELLHDKNVYRTIKQIRVHLHQEINAHYPQILFNYQSDKCYITIEAPAKKKGTPLINPLPNVPNPETFFSSPFILNQLFRNSTIFFHLKRQGEKIDNLFTLIPPERGYRKQIRGELCFYHDCSDIISWCDVCCESYCCVKQCFRHRICTLCHTRGCRCDSFECGCPPMSLRQRNQHYNKIIQKFGSRGQTDKQTIMNVTENYKYCFRCAPETLSSRTCLVCKKICSWGYLSCKKCRRVWHKKCSSKVKIPDVCPECCKGEEFINSVQQYLFIETKAKIIKMTKIQKYLPFIIQIYFREGIRLTLQQTEELILVNYDQFQIRQKYFKLYENKCKPKQSEPKTKKEFNSIFLMMFNKYSPEIRGYQVNPLQYLEKMRQMFEKKFISHPGLSDSDLQNFYFRLHEQFLSQLKKKELSESQIKHQPTNPEVQQKKDMNSAIPEQKKLNLQKKDEAYINIRAFLLWIYEESKYVLRRGSICVLKRDKNYLRILKKWGKGREVQIRLFKKSMIWIIEICGKTHLVNSIDDIIEKLRDIAPIENFQELTEFLGFSIYEHFYQPQHFTLFLQTHLLDQMPLTERMAKVTELYDTFTWKQNGLYWREGPEDPGKELSDENPKVPFDFNVTEKEIFYLKKRKNKKKDEDQQASRPPYITFQDLKKHLTETLPASIKPQSTISLKNSSISNQVFIAPSKIHKLGLFSRKSLKKSTIVIEYIGEIVSESVADLRQKKFQQGCYMFGLIKSPDKRDNDKKDIIDATFRGNMARYLNHSCDPNCKAKIEYINGFPRIIIYTVRDVQQFEELTYDYQFNVETEEKIQCTCGAKNCQGRLN